MSFKNEVGVVSNIPEDNFSNTLFSENLGIIIETNKKDVDFVKKIVERDGVSYDIIGETVKEKTVTINKKISLDIKEIKSEWERALREKLLS